MPINGGPRVLKITLGEVSALLLKVNQIRKTPEAIAGIQINIKNNPAIEAQFKEALNMTNTDLTQTRPNTNILYKYKIHLILWTSLCSPKRDTPPSHELSEYFSNNLNIKHP